MENVFNIKKVNAEFTKREIVGGMFDVAIVASKEIDSESKQNTLYHFLKSHSRLESSSNYVHFSDRIYSMTLNYQDGIVLSFLLKTDDDGSYIFTINPNNPIDIAQLVLRLNEFDCVNKAEIDAVMLEIKLEVEEYEE